jgi:pimeloyl-ACP methyl ester carboxylesterase
LIVAAGGNTFTATPRAIVAVGDVPEIAANGLTLHYESIGDPSQPPVILIMGLAVQMVLWPDGFCKLLADKGFHVIRFDNRDVGLSTHLDHLGTPNIPLEFIRYQLGMPIRSRYSLDDMASDTAALIGVLGSRYGFTQAHLVGASMGGMIAQNLAASLPDRLMSLTSIMSTTGRRSLPKASWRAMRALLTPPAKRGDTEGAIRRMMHVFRTISSRTHPPVEARLREICSLHVQRANNPAGAARQLTAIAAAGDRTSIVRQIKVPTLVLHGDEDELIPYPAGLETARVIREGGGRADATIVEGMGHDLPEPLWPTLVERIAAHASLHASVQLPSDRERQS